MKLALFLVSCLIPFGFTIPEAEIQLKYQFKSGDQYSWVQFKKQSVKQSIMGMDHEMHNNMHSEYLLKVVDVAEQTARIEAQFVKIKTNSRSIIGQMNMDSEGPAELTETRLIKSVIGKSFFVSISGTGKITKLEGLENLTGDLDKIVLDNQQQELMVAMLRQFLSEGALKANFKEVFIEYPQEKLKLGDKWTTKIQPGLNFPIMLENTWSLAEILPANVNLAGEGVITTADKESTIDFARIKAKADLSGKQVVKTNINLKTGWPYKQDATAELNGTMRVAGGGMIPADMDIPVQVFYKSTHVVKRRIN